MTRDLLGVHDDDEIAGVDVRRVLRLPLAAQRVGDARGETPEGLALGVDDVPARSIRRFAFQVFMVLRSGGQLSADGEVAAITRPARAPGRRQPERAIQSAGSATAAAPADGDADPPSPCRRRRRASASAAPVDAESRSQKPTSLPRSDGRGEVDELGGRRDEGEVPAQAEAEERDRHAGDARRARRARASRPPSRRARRHERARRPMPVDQVADDEHEPEHPEDVRADDREDVAAAGGRGRPTT